MPSPLIRPAVLADIDRCLALAAPAAATPTDLEGDLGNPSRFIVVAEVAGTVVGYGRTTHFRRSAEAPADCAPSGHYLVGLAVAPSLRRQGIGTALTHARLEWIWAQAREAWYFANSRNVASIALLARFGFREVTRAFAFPGVGFGDGEGILFCAVPPG